MKLLWGFLIEFNSKKIPNKDAEISFWIKGSSTERIRLYWIGNGAVAIGMHSDLKIKSLVVPKEFRNRLFENLVGKINVGKYLQIGEAYHNWFWISEVEELINEPRLSYESWEKFQSKEFAERSGGWVIQIYNAYKSVSSDMESF